MAIDQETEMTDVEIDDFLRRSETGVLSLARTDEPYAIPISYSYDDGEREFYMRMVSTPDSEKRQFLGLHRKRDSSSTTKRIRPTGASSPQGTSSASSRRS